MLMVVRAQPELRVLALRGRRELPVVLARQALMVLRVRLERQGLREQRDRSEQRERQALPVVRVRQEQQVHLAAQAPRA